MKQEFRINLFLFVLCLSIYAANIWFKKLEISFNYPFIRNHLNDTLATQAFLSCAGCLLNCGKRHSVYRLRHVMLITCTCSFVWEYCAQYLNPKSTFDYIDILCYFLGGFIYWIYVKLFIKEKINGPDS